MSIMIETSRFFYENFTGLWVLAIILGSWTVFSQIFRLFNFIYVKLIRKRKNLSNQYGKGTWALITGSSEGIGKAFAFALAKEHFNIILTARTQSKLKQVKNQLQKQFPEIQVKYIAVDFASQPDKDDIQKGWYKQNQLDKLDISIIVNNAGVDCLDKIIDLDLKTVFRLIDLDCFFVNSMHYLFLQRFMKEVRTKQNKHKYLIINVASLAAELPTSYFSAYNACKVYVDKLTRATALQYPEVDFMSLKPSQVSTRMTGFKNDVFTVTPQKCVESVLNDVGYQTFSHGHTSHAIQGFIYSIIPSFLFNLVWKNIVLPDFIRARKGQQLEK